MKQKIFKKYNGNIGEAKATLAAPVVPPLNSQLHLRISKIVHFAKN